MDIRNGDILVLGGKEYPIRAVSWWEGAINSGGFARMAVKQAATKRSPAIAGGKIGAAVTQEASITCMPLDPLDPEVRQRLGLQTPHELLQTYVPDQAGGGFYYLVLEELKR